MLRALARPLLPRRFVDVLDDREHDDRVERLTCLDRTRELTRAPDEPAAVDLPALRVEQVDADAGGDAVATDVEQLAVGAADVEDVAARRDPGQGPADPPTLQRAVRRLHRPSIRSVAVCIRLRRSADASCRATQRSRRHGFCSTDVSARNVTIRAGDASRAQVTSEMPYPSGQPGNRGVAAHDTGSS